MCFRHRIGHLTESTPRPPGNGWSTIRIERGKDQPPEKSQILEKLHLLLCSFFGIGFFPKPMSGVGGWHDGTDQGKGRQTRELPTGEENSTAHLDRPVHSDHGQGVVLSLRVGLRGGLDCTAISLRLSDGTHTFSDEG